jgi:hypothetical protein
MNSILIGIAGMGILISAALLYTYFGWRGILSSTIHGLKKK